MKFYMTKDSFFLVNVYGKTRIFFACTLYYIILCSSVQRDIAGGTSPNVIAVGQAPGV